MFRRTSPTSVNFTLRRRTQLMIARLLILCLSVQAFTPPVMAAPAGPSPIVVTLGKGTNRLLTTLALVEQSLVVFLRAMLTPQEQWNVVLTPVTAEFKDYAGLDYHHSSRKLLLAANTPGGTTAQLRNSGGGWDEVCVFEPRGVGW